MVEEDLEENEEGMAQLNIHSSHTASPSPDIHVVMDIDALEVAVPTSEAAAKEPEEFTEQSLFIIDSVGDSSLRPNIPAPTVRDFIPELANDGSEDDVIVFRGRRDPVVVRDDPPIAKGAPSRSGGRNIEPVASPRLSSVAAPSASNDRPLEEDLPDTTPCRRSKQKSSKSHRRSRPGKLANSKRTHHIYHSDDDIDEDVFRDYVANMSGNEELLGIKQASTEDEWASSILDETESADPVISDAVEIDSSLTKLADKADPKGRRNPLRKARFTEKHPDKLPPEMLVQIAAQLPTMEFSYSDMEEDEEDGGDDEVDEDGTSDPGDDSDLESDLEYTAQERWEDEEDLRQRQIDALTDEEIAKILAKQEDLGMGSDEILLLDDTGFGDLSRAQAGLNAILADPAHPNRRKKKKGGRQDHFPSASLMADVLEQDPYGGFDVMDFDRPSLRANTKGQKGRKSAGAMPEELADLSDSDLVDNLQSAWANDRSKKAAKKVEREELRAQGLLGRANKFKADLSVKFSDGMSLDDVRAEMKVLLSDPNMTTKAFPPMDKKERKLLHEIAHALELTSTSRGSGKNRFTVLTKRARTPGWDDMRWNRVQRIANRGFLRGSGKGSSGIGGAARAGRGGGFSKAATGYANGEVVGAAAPEIAPTSFGHKLMLKMGWEKGTALGKAGEGMLLPVEARVKSGRGGLG